MRTAAALHSNAEIFAANRATGHIALSVAASAGRTRRTRVHEDGSLRVRFPNAPADTLEAVIVNTGGGMTGGDRFAVEIALGEGARLVAGTAAAEKIYRSTGPDAEMDVTLDVGAGAQLAWLPQETILFDRARLARRIDVDLAGRRVAADGGGGGVRPRRHGRGDAPRLFRRPLARAPRRQACLRRQRAARRRHRRQAWRSPRPPPAASPSPPC